jgi:hypothetical protein
VLWYSRSDLGPQRAGRRRMRLPYDNAMAEALSSLFRTECIRTP